MSIDLFASLSPLERVLDFHMARHNVLAANLANAETPGFRPRDLRFDALLDNATALVRTDQGHLAGAETPPGTTLTEDEAMVGPDQNGVRLEQVMAQITANRLRYETGVELARRRLALLRYAATDGSP
ncbi:MAG: flagellar basal body rod protein FlgB [Deltaproteobacteria bacterium]|nr:flagellar basal body rod protein FlgB [Deltaproteobacteria bacterium]